MATKLALLTMATGAMSQAFAGAGSAPGTGAIGAGAAGGAGAGAAGAAGAQQAAPSIALPKPQTVLPLYLFNIDPQPLVASVLAAPNAQTTTLAIACVPGEPAEACGLPPAGITVTHVSSSIFQASFAFAGQPGKTNTVSWGCTLTSEAGAAAAPTTLPPGMGMPNANAAVCAASASRDGVPGKSTTVTIPAPTMYANVQIVGVTAGAEKLAVTAGGGDAGAATGGAAATTSGAAAATTGAVAGAAGGAITSTGSGVSASMSMMTSSLSSEVAAKTSSIVASASKAAANASSAVASATTAGAAHGSTASSFLVSLVSAVVFGSLVYVL